MKSIKILCLPIVLFLASCVSMSPVDTNTFVVSGSTGEFKCSATELEVELLRIANSYCSSLNNKVTHGRYPSFYRTIDNNASAELKFKCLLADDLELRIVEAKQK